MSVAIAIDGRALRGARSRAAVLDVASDLATIDGLDGLSIASVAVRASMSKAGVAGLFGSKQQLQLATVAHAREVYMHEVTGPALAVPGGLDRVLAMAESSLRYSEARIFEGGCFFSSTSAELGSRPGPVRDAVLACMAEWHGFVRHTVQRAIDKRDLVGDADLLAFEIAAVLEAANRRSLLYDSAEPYVQARASVARLLAEASIR